MEVEASSFCTRVVWKSSIMPRLLGRIDDKFWEERAICIVPIHPRIASPGSKWFLQANEYRGSFKEEEVSSMWQIEYPGRDVTLSVKVSSWVLLWWVTFVFDTYLINHISVCRLFRDSPIPILSTRQHEYDTPNQKRCSKSAFRSTDEEIFLNL